MSKLTRKQKREIRELVKAILVRKLLQLNMSTFKDHPSDQEIEYASYVLHEITAGLQPASTEDVHCTAHVDYEPSSRKAP